MLTNSDLKPYKKARHLPNPLKIHNGLKFINLHYKKWPKNKIHKSC